MKDKRLRALILSGLGCDSHPAAALLGDAYNIDLFPDVEQSIDALKHNEYDAVFADIGDFLPLERGIANQQASQILDTIGEGVCIVDAQGHCSWSNKRMQSFSPDIFERVKQICMQARSVFESQITAGNIKPDQLRARKYSMDVSQSRYFELITSAVVGADNQVLQVVAVVWDATSGRRLQQKLDAIDKAGQEIAKLECESISKLSPGQRLELLRDKIIRFSKELMQFDHFAIRLLEKRTNKLELVIAEGLPAAAMEVDIYAQPEGNGISGYVAATGRSYICHDTEKDARYILGMRHSMSSLTVPLRLHDKVIGIFNIESDKVGAFDEDDRQFAEIFGRYVAMALNILDLLVVERYTTSGLMADSVVQEMNQPLVDIVTQAQSLMEEYIGDDAMRSRLNVIVDKVANIRQTIKDVATGPQRVLGAADIDDLCEESTLMGKRVLIADDEANIRNTLGQILTKYGCDCVVCKDGYEAISFVEQQRFDLVLSDIRMPHRNGYEIYAAVRRRDDDTPVILMTGFGYDPSHSIVRASQEGLSAVLYKPFKVDQLLEDVYNALGITPGN